MATSWVSWIPSDVLTEIRKFSHSLAILLNYKRIIIMISKDFEHVLTSKLVFTVLCCEDGSACLNMSTMANLECAFSIELITF